ncbi:hypothetical protein [African swine fever virus]|uniref:Uncharacterized protein n=1 Tax=African swine fever virus TaxID=10497 RepID=A0A3G1EVC7_ASF|nr:hypothetical protein F8221_gp213 [African swine fever virus]AOO54517.1 hypothetical protein AFSV47Ss_0212 [African swine fever virus]QIM08493.1 hypothetical protein [African swine fever virus]QIM08726.1 hypothetical protein [African swine fever virus]QIM08959.1 hypothetical protein [African swine fever virus]QPL11889.1 hypothetical protein [African swine fever virus]
MLSLQTIAKMAVATNTYSKYHYPILKVFGLWWKNSTLNGPIKICNHCNNIMVGEYPMCYNHGMSLDIALIRAVKERNISLVQLFTEWGGNIDYGHFVLTLHLCKDYVKVWEPNHQRAECIWMLLYIFQIP